MRIALTYTGTDRKHENYVRWLTADEEGIEVVRLEAGGGGSIIGCDALVLSGGVDIYPGYYKGGVEYPGGGGWRPERDAFELEMLEAALVKGLPVLGVCRGLQLINVYQKGTLVQDLGPAGDIVHEGVPGADKEHRVLVDAGTVLGEVVGFEGEGRGGAACRGIVNSAHHQAVDQLGVDLRVTCRAEDGTIEGLEWREPAARPFLMAVQWHPERMYVNGVGDEGFYRGVRERFIDEIKRNIQ
jgi:putative glutamine amidotransferase